MNKKMEFFINNYAQMLKAGNPDALTRMHQLPSIFMLEKERYVVTCPHEARSVNQLLVAAVQDRKVADVEPVVRQNMYLSENFVFITVQWCFKNAAGQIAFTNTCSYTLQQDANASDELKIVVAVIDGQELGLLRQQDEVLM